MKIIDAALLLVLLASVPMMRRGFRNYALRLRTASSAEERTMAKNGIYLGLGISAGILVSALTIVRHLIT